MLYNKVYLFFLFTRLQKSFARRYVEKINLYNVLEYVMLYLNSPMLVIIYIVYKAKLHKYHRGPLESQVQIAKYMCCEKS